MSAGIKSPYLILSRIYSVVKFSDPGIKIGYGKSYTYGVYVYWVVWVVTVLWIVVSESFYCVKLFNKSYNS